MVLLDQLAPLVPLINFCFFILCVPFVSWVNNKTRSDWICVSLGIFYMIFYGVIIQPHHDEWLFFYLGLVIGYVTDYMGVKTKKWKYHPWDPEYGYSRFGGFAWGMTSMFTYMIGKTLSVSSEMFFFPEILLLVPVVTLEWKYGETRRDQYFLFARAIFTFFAFFFSNNLGLLFVACCIGSYIEFVGVTWIKNWLYIDTMSYVFLSFGYSLVILTIKVIVDLLIGNFIEPLLWFFFILAILCYGIDLFYFQKKAVIKYGLDTSAKVVVVAERFQQEK